MFRAVNGAMAALFALATVVQFNDPDSLPWIGIYGVATALSVQMATRGVLPAAAPLAVGVIALIWVCTGQRMSRTS